MGLLGGIFYLNLRKVRSLLNQALGNEISTCAIYDIHCRLKEGLATLMEEAAEAICD